jgi:leucyl aminopeptidase (aminopeptidase T)
MHIDPSSQAGARQLVQHCLGLQTNQQLVIFVDETTTEPAAAIAQAAEELGIAHTSLFVPSAIQQRIPAQSDLSLLAQGAAREARAILTCVNSAPECLPFRRRILETQWTARTRIGHMPGASLEVLKLADVDMARLVADCRCLEVVMARGQQLELISYTASGRAHSLTVDLGGWARLPVASDGVINDGAWGNVPSGETYIAPIEGSGQGSIAITGSIPGLVIEPGQELVLHFEDGRLARIEPESGPAASWLHHSQIATAEASQDPNWRNLAEIGVGLNPAVERLTGNMLFDEKAAGTAHIALGSNTFMGGIVASSIHCDMITLAPTILADGKTVVERGQLAYRPADWHEHHGSVSLGDSPWQTATAVARSGVQASRAPDGRLQRVLRPEPGRVSACFVGDYETAQLASTLYDLIPDASDWLSVERLAAQAGLKVNQVRSLLHIMSSYDLLRYR